MVPGAFMRGFGPYLTMSPATAVALGIAVPEYVGDFEVAAEGTTPKGLATARELIMQDSNLVMVALPQFPCPWGSWG